MAESISRCEVVIAPLHCRARRVEEYSSMLGQSRRQISHQVIKALMNQCKVMVQPTLTSTPAPPPKLIGVGEIHPALALFYSIDLALPALKTEESSLSLQDVCFKIGKPETSTVIISGTVKIRMHYTGSDGLCHQQTELRPFYLLQDAEIPIPGHSLAEGGMVLDRVLEVKEYDAELLVITGLSFHLFISTVVRILVPEMIECRG